MAILTQSPNLTSQQSQRVFGRRELLSDRADCLWKIDRGVVRTFTWDDEGSVIVLGHWGTGDIVGHALSKIHPYRIECLSSVEATLLPSYLWYRVMDSAISHIQQTEELLNIVRSRPMDFRLLQALRWFANKFGRPVETGTLIDVRLTHQEIAEAIGTTRVTVTRLLQQFEQDELIGRYSGRFIVVFPRAFEKEVVRSQKN